MKGWGVWVTGLPGSGKSTIAAALKPKLVETGVPYQLLSIDKLRKIVTPQPGYSQEERDLVYGSLIFTAFMLTTNGINVLIDATGNRRQYRDKARNLIERFAEVYVKCPLNICIEREKKRKRRYGAPREIYEKGLKQKSTTIPGLGSPYEEPLNPEVVIKSNLISPEEASDRIMNMLKMKFKIK